MAQARSRLAVDTSSGVPGRDDGRRRTVGADTALPVCEGNAARVIAAAVASMRSRGSATLAIVLETEGSTYAGVGTLALFDGDDHVGWLSGGCLEPEIARRAREASIHDRLGWLEIDTRDDEALLSGSATGCRGRQRLALLPLRALPGFDAACAAWLDGHQAFTLVLSGDGSIAATTQATRHDWRIAASAIEWTAPRSRWTQVIARPPEVLLLGAGPEMATLVPLLRDLGWRVTAADRRMRWRAGNSAVMDILDLGPGQALQAASRADAVLVMHHDFELDREALAALAPYPARYVGLLGPARRRDDIFKLLGPAQREAVLPRLRSPIGVDLGGRGPETIALSIATQLQAWRHGSASTGAPRT